MKRIRIVTGHYGSGKTEYAVNLALSMAGQGLNTALADLDIVNPYFRSHEQTDLLTSRSVRVIVTSCGGRIDLPAIPPEVLTIFENPDLYGILDLGGDPIGARVLARFAPQLAHVEFDMLFVLNANRPETRTVEGALDYLHSIEASSGQKITQIVNNTHLCRQTQVEDILKGAALAKALSEVTELPIVHHVVERRLLPQISEQLGTDASILPIDILMKKPWETEEEYSWLEL